MHDLLCHRHLPTCNFRFPILVAGPSLYWGRLPSLKKFKFWCFTHQSCTWAAKHTAVQGYELILTTREPLQCAAVSTHKHFHFSEENSRHGRVRTHTFSSEVQCLSRWPTRERLSRQSHFTVGTADTYCSFSEHYSTIWNNEISLLPPHASSPLEGRM